MTIDYSGRRVVMAGRPVYLTPTEYRVGAVNAVGEGDWSEQTYTQLWPRGSEQVLVSPTNITVTEGGTFTFTVSLNRAPPMPVALGLYPRRAADSLLHSYLYSEKVLIPSSWSHPDEDYPDY